MIDPPVLKKELILQSLSSRYAVRRLGEGDVEAIYELSAGNPLFFEHCPPFVTRQSIRRDMQALPPRKTYEDKFYVGFFRQEKMVAILDLILAYPREDTAFIGLFMMDPSEQGRGMGSAIVREIFAQLHALGYASVRLAFAKGNPQSEALWTKNGFQKTGLESQEENYTAVIMERPLP